jgi:hypothetical protein
MRKILVPALAAIAIVLPTVSGTAEARFFFTGHL